MAVELGQGYISVTARTDGMASAIGKGLSGAQGQADSAGEGMGARLAGGLSKTLKVGAVAAGVAVGGVLTAAITKGMGRLIAIENAEAKLEGLGHSATTVTKIMDNALASVSGTAFGLGEAASIAASAVAAGVKPGQDLERTLKLTGDAATIAGVGMEDMGAIFNKVAASNKVQGTIIMQLNKAGIPIVQLLGKEMGKTSDEILDMSRKGTISFADFQDAMESGLGGAALTSGATFQGALANMGAALGRFGAELVGPAFTRGPATFALLTTQIDKATTAVKPFVAAFDAWLNSDGIPKLVAFGEGVKNSFESFRSSALATDSMGRLESVFMTLGSAASTMWPALKKIASSLAEASAATGVSTWKVLLSTVEAAAVILDGVVAPALNGIASIMESNQGIVTGLAIAFLAFKTIPAIMGRLAGSLAPIGAAAGRARIGVVGFGSAMRDSWKYAGQANPQISNFGRTMTIAGGNARAALGGIGSAARGAVGALGGLGGIGVMAGIAAIMSITSQIQGTARHAKILTSDSNAAASSMGLLTDAFVDAGGKIDTEVFAEVSNQITGIRRNLTEAAGNGAGFFERNILSIDRASTEAKENAKAAALSTEKAFDALGWSNEKLSEGISGSASEWNALKNALLATGDGGALAVAKLAPLRSNFERLQAIQKTVTPGSLEVAAAFKIIGDEASTADQKTSALKSAMNALVGGVPDLTEATADAGETVRKLAKSAADGWDGAQGFGGALRNLDGSLDASSENGARFAAEIMEAKDNLAAVAMAGGDYREKLDEINASLYSSGEQLGQSTAQVDVFTSRLGLIPDVIDTAVAVSGAGAVAAELGHLKTEFDQIADGDEKNIKIAALTDEARAAIEGIDFQVNDLDDGMFEIIPKTDEAEGKLATLIGMVAGIPADKVLDVSAPGVHGVIDALNTIGIKVRSDNEKGIVIEDNSPETIKKLDALNITTTTLKDGTVVVTDNVDDVKKSVNGLNILRTSSTHTISIREMMDSGGIGALNWPASASGARLPRNNAGSRLPTSGPGTEVTDGILGVNQSTGAPISWLDGGEWVVNNRSSSKWNRLLAAINRDDPRLASLPALQSGGVIAGLSAARSKEGNLYQWGGIGPTNFDCSGFVGFIQQIVMGISEAVAAGKRLYTTNSLLGGSTAGLVKGYNSASPFNVGVNSEHMAATLEGHAIESGGGSTPSSSGVDGGRNNALSAQFGTQFHLPLALVDGGYEGGALSAATEPVWTDKDELDLKSARIAITQAQEAAQKVRDNPKKSDADRAQAELKVEKAEQKVAGLEAKKEGKTGVQALTAPPAPPLGGAMGDDAIGLRQAEMAVTDAQLSRDETYAKAESTSMDKEKADLAVYSAQNRLVETQKQLGEANNALAAGGGVKGAAQRFASEAVGIGYDAFWDIIGFNEPRWFGMDMPTVPDKHGKSDSVSVAGALRDVPSSFSDAEIANQNPSADMDEWIKKQRPALHDEGGWLEPGLTLNLTKKPEAVFNGPQLATLTRIANLDQQPAGERERTVEVHHHYHLTDVKDIEHIKRQDRQRQMLQWGR